MIWKTAKLTDVSSCQTLVPRRVKRFGRAGSAGRVSSMAGLAMSAS